jgi:hypothetical protein
MNREKVASMLRPRRLAPLLALLSTTSLAQDQGPQFRVNSYTTEYSRPPAIASDAAGNFVVVWAAVAPSIESSNVNVYARRYARTGAPLGPDFLVSTLTTYGGYRPRVAADSSGDFVVVWVAAKTGPHSVWGQRYSSSGTPLGGQFRVNTTTPYVGNPAVAWNGSGGFVVVWDDISGLDGYGAGIFGQRFSGAGAPLGGEFGANLVKFGDQTRPRVAMNGTGGFVVVWESPDQDGTGVFAQRFDAGGSALGFEFLVNSFTTGDQITPDVSAGADGRFVVVWTDVAQDVSGPAVFGKRFDASGSPLGSEFGVAGGVLNLTNDAPSVSSDPFGSFVVAWQINAFFMGTPIGVDVGARLFLWNGADGGHSRVNTYATGNQVLPAVTSSYDGFVVTWLGYGQDSPSDLGALVYAQRFTPGLRGDANGDGKVDVADVFYLINALFAGGPPPLGVADVNGDGKVDVADVFYLINYLFAGGPSPA